MKGRREMNHKNEPSNDCVSKKQEKSWTASLAQSLKKDSDADIEPKEAAFSYTETSSMEMTRNSHLFME
jgi:hypothetical protein